MSVIRKRGNYQFQAIVRRKGFPLQTKTFNSHREAEAWAANVESEMFRNVFVSRVEAERFTLKELIERYVEEVTPSHKGAESEALRLRMLARTPLAERIVGTLKPQDFAHYRDARLKTRKPASVVRELALFSRVLTVAGREWGVNMVNPLTYVSRPSVRNERTRYLTHEEETVLLAELEPQGRDAGGRLEPGGTQCPWAKPIVQIALETAMRRSELLGLTWHHLDLKKRVATLPDTKNGHRREVPLSSTAARILDQLPRSIDGRVFPVTPAALKTVYERAVERAGLVDLTFHDLRRTATSRLAKRLSLLDLAKVTGHRQINVLHQRYYTVTAEELALRLG